MSTAAVERPTSVTVAVTVGWLAVIIDVLIGVGLILLANNDEVLDALGTSGDTARGIGIGSLVVGAIVAILVWRLGSGGNVARLLVSVVMAVRAFWAIYAIFVFGSHVLSEALISLAISITVFALLWNDKANAFYGSR